MYIRVYAPSGEAFDVTRERADKLILDQGWTQSPPTPAKKKKAAPAKVPFALTDSEE